jgi:hypothetical protein
VHVHHQPKLLDRHFAEAAVAKDACIVHQDVDAAPLAQNLSGHPADCIFVGDGADAGDRLTTDIANCRNRLVDMLAETSLTPVTLAMAGTLIETATVSGANEACAVGNSFPIWNKYRT